MMVVMAHLTPSTTLVERPGRVEVRAPMATGLRFVFAVLALVPLLAPYELIWSVRWQTLLHPFALVAGAISAGAIVLSALLAFAALAGLSVRIVFDAGAGTFTYVTWAPVVRSRAVVLPLAAIVEVGVGERAWSDGSPSYHLRVATASGEVFEAASSWERAEVERLVERVLAAVPQVTAAPVAG